MKYACIQFYHDSGKVSSNVIPAGNLTEKYRNHTTFDEYVDIFESKEEAEAFEKEAFES